MKILEQIKIIGESNLLNRDYNFYSTSFHTKLGQFVSIDNSGRLVGMDTCDNVIGVVHKICNSNSWGDVVKIYNGDPYSYTPVYDKTHKKT